MAKTVFATNNALKKVAYEEELFRDTLPDSYFYSRFMGESKSSIVQVNTKVEKGQGDQVKFGIRMNLNPVWVLGSTNTQLEGNESKLTTYDFSLTLEQYRTAVRDNGELDRKRPMFDIDAESEAALKEAGADKIDELCFTALQTSPTKCFYGSAASTIAAAADLATAKTSTVAAGKLDMTMISALRTWAETGGNGAYVPLRPVKVEGGEYYILLCPPDVLFDLKTNSNFQQAMREAQERGKSNPLFKNATAIVDGVVVHSHRKMNTGTAATGQAQMWGQCAFMGAQSLCWAWGKRPKIIQDTFDYENEHGYAWNMICKTGKPVFNSLDYGSIGLVVTRSNIAGL